MRYNQAVDLRHGTTIDEVIYHDLPKKVSCIRLMIALNESRMLVQLSWCFVRLYFVFKSCEMTICAILLRQQFGYNTTQNDGNRSNQYLCDSDYIKSTYSSNNKVSSGATDYLRSNDKKCIKLQTKDICQIGRAVRRLAGQSSFSLNINLALSISLVMFNSRKIKSNELVLFFYFYFMNKTFR